MKGDRCRYLEVPRLDHAHPPPVIPRPAVKDGVARRIIDQWLNAGVLEEEALQRPVAGVPQGGVISMMLSTL
ncbi:MAG: hypothetical protein OXL41_15225 [Nitrospinae bacterium]|nr:hypothetical protein [Nitrospinota bacterium]